MTRRLPVQRGPQSAGRIGQMARVMMKTVIAVFAGGLLMLPSVPTMAQSRVVQTTIYHSLEAGKPAKNAGRLRCRIVSIDYAADQLVVQSNHGNEIIAVLPSTTLYHGRQYETLSDLRAGQEVEIELSEIDGRLVAQTIRF
jgi:hypothetical protein